MAAPTNFPSDVVPQAPEDPLFGLMAAYRADESPDKVDLVSHCLPNIRAFSINKIIWLISNSQGIGAYRDDNAKPWILPVVKKVPPLPFQLSQSYLTRP
jgi:aspartate aminotransferase